MASGPGAGAPNLGSRGREHGLELPGCRPAAPRPGLRRWGGVDVGIQDGSPSGSLRSSLTRPLEHTIDYTASRTGRLNTVSDILPVTRRRARLSGRGDRA